MASTIRGARNGWLVLLTAVLVLSLAACGQKDDDDFFVGNVELPNTDEVIGEVAVGDLDGSYVADEMPSGAGEAPSVLGSSQYILGASVVLMVTTEDTATELIVSVRNTETGYYRVDLAGATKRDADDVTVGGGSGDGAKLNVSKFTGQRDPEAQPQAEVDYILTLTPAPDAAYNSFVVEVVAYDGSNYTEARAHGVRPNATAGSSSNLQVSLNWVHPVDMDLHVETPTGTDIYWANRAADGGALDLDSNAGCSIDNVNNENITWLSQVPANGGYTIRVNLWSACEEPGPFPYVVTLMLGGEPTSFWGEMTLADAYAGGAQSGSVISQFSLSPAGLVRLADR